MMAARSVDDYIASFPPAMRQRLTLVRSTIRKALPDAQEAISYGIVGYKVDGRPVVYFGGFAKHYSLFGGTSRTRALFGKRVEPFLGGKGTIQFPLGLPVPVDLVRDVALARLEEVRGVPGQPAKSARRATRRATKAGKVARKGARTSRRPPLPSRLPRPGRAPRRPRSSRS